MCLYFVYKSDPIFKKTPLFQSPQSDKKFIHSKTGISILNRLFHARSYTFKVQHQFNYSYIFSHEGVCKVSCTGSKNV